MQRPGDPGTRRRLSALSVAILLLSLTRFAALAARTLTRLLAGLARGRPAAALPSVRRSLSRSDPPSPRALLPAPGPGASPIRGPDARPAPGRAVLVTVLAVSTILICSGSPARPSRPFKNWGARKGQGA